MVEKLGWSFVEKARESFDPGFYKLAEQCALCLDSKQEENQRGGQPAERPLSTARSIRSARCCCAATRCTTCIVSARPKRSRGSWSKREGWPTTSGCSATR